MLLGARASSSGDRTRLDRTSCPGPSMMMPNGFARWRIPGETGSQRVQPAGVCWQGLVHHAPNLARCTDDQPTIKGRTSANFGYSNPLFACVHRTFGDQFIAPARAIFFTFTNFLAQPRPGMRLRRPTPTRALIHRPTNGGHCGGDRSVLRLRAVVARTNWRGLVYLLAYANAFPLQVANGWGRLLLFRGGMVARPTVKKKEGGCCF